jgi:hypothetical protein
VALPIWPALLPVMPTLAGSTFGPLAPQPLVTPMEDGLQRQRARSTTHLSQVTLRFKLSGEQFRMLEQFLRETLNQGVQRFEMPVWKPGGTVPPPTRTVQLVGGLAAVKWETTGSTHFASLPLSVRDY